MIKVHDKLHGLCEVSDQSYLDLNFETQIGVRVLLDHVALEMTYERGIKHGTHKKSGNVNEELPQLSKQLLIITKEDSIFRHDQRSI